MCKGLVFSKIPAYSLLFRVNFIQSVPTVSTSMFAHVPRLFNGHLPHFSAICWEVLALLIASPQNTRYFCSSWEA